MLTFAIASTASAQPPAPIPPKTVTLSKPNASLGDVLKDLSTQSGFAVASPGLDPQTPCPVAFDRTPFWIALDQIAAKTGTKISLGNRGQQITLTKRTGPRPPSSVDGPFRVIVRQVNPRIDFDSGNSFVDLTLDIHWEPRFPVFRIDGQPVLTALTADAGTPSANTAKARTAPPGSHFTTTIRIEGVPRSATRLTRVAGTFTVTASPAMVPFVFENPTGPFPVQGKPPKADERVSAILKRLDPLNDLWEAEVEVTYPPNGPEFESFESWVTENRAKLVSPTSQPTPPADFEHGANGNRVSGLYRFKTRPGKGWTLVYETPAPLVEFAVRFDLRDIPLP